VSDKRLNSLFDALVDEMAKLLKEGKPVIDKDTGEVHAGPADAATLNVIRQFLKDNNITGSGEAQDPVKKLAQLPFPIPSAKDMHH
jgi:hypothetical protein